MASLYDSASLVMIPSGYKDDKLYSIKPTDGSGDFTFSRDGAGASPATRVNASGLIEKGRENLLTYSNDFSNAAWNPTNVITTGGQSGYDGSSDAWLLQCTSTFGWVYPTISTSGVQTFSIYAKAGNVGVLRLQTLNVGTNAFFNLSTGALGTLNAGVIDASIEAVGGGWYRCSFSVNESLVGIKVSPQSSEFVVNNGDNIYIQDAQLEQGLVATDYIETTTAPVSAGLLGDMPRLDYSGGATCPSLLLEPSRVNSITSSEYLENWNTLNAISVNTNNATSPEGVQNATNLVPNTSNTEHFIDKSGFSRTSGEYIAHTVYAKANGYSYLNMSNSASRLYAAFDLANGEVDFVGSNGTDFTNHSAAIESVGNGWYRCTLIGEAVTTSATYMRLAVCANSTNASTQTFTGDGTSGVLVYGAQAELNSSYPTSYIPCYGSASTRAADNAVATHTIADTETLTFFTEFIAPEQQSGGGEHLLENSSGSIRIRIYQNNSTSIRIRTDVPSANFDYSYSSLGISVGDRVKVCLRVDSGIMTAFINGVEKNTFGAATINFAKMHLRPQTIMNVDSTIIFPTALTDAECIALTTI